jgi:hypothetical protein
MTRSEFAQAAVVLDQCWPGDFDETAEAAYYALLRDLTTEQVEYALVRLRTAKFRPSVSEIVNAVGITDRSERLVRQRDWCVGRYGVEKANELFPQLEPVRELAR